MNKALLVTGATGFVGHTLCVEAARRGLVVTGAVRSNRVLPVGVNAIVVNEVDGTTDWSRAVDKVDVVVHLAARVHVMCDAAAHPLDEFRRVNVAGTGHFARSAVSSGVKRLVYVSSIKVNGDETHGDSKFTETDTPDPQDPYGISKWEAEQALHRIAEETGLEVVIVRPPLVYGAGVKGNFSQMIKVLAKGIPLPLASVQNLRSLIYVGNLVDALIMCATHPAAAGQTYLVSDCEDISTSDLLHQLATAMGLPAHLFSCPLSLLKLAGHLTGKSDQVERLLGSLQVDSSRIRHELGWKPPFSLQQGLRLTVVS